MKWKRAAWAALLIFACVFYVAAVTGLKRAFSHSFSGEEKVGEAIGALVKENDLLPFLIKDISPRNPPRDREPFVDGQFFEPLHIGMGPEQIEHAFAAGFNRSRVPIGDIRCNAGKFRSAVIALGLVHTQDRAGHFNIERWRLSRVLQRHGAPERVQIHGEFGGLASYISSNLRLPDVLSDVHRVVGGLDRLAGLNKSFTDEVDTNGGDNQGSARYYRHPERPPRHFRLGYEIVFGPIMFIGGLYYVVYAFRHGGRIKEQTALFNLLLGLAGILSGIALLFALTSAYR